MSWPMHPINELCDLAVDCVNKTAPIVDYETEFKMIRTTNIKNGFIDLNGVRYVTEEVFKKWTRRSQPQYGDVILTREAPVGEVGRFTSDDDKIFLGQRLFHYRPNPKKLDWNFLAYVLQSPSVQGRFKGMGFGATVDHVRVGDAEHLPIPCPPLEIQKKIGGILSAYDDLIENNRRRIQLLEQAARLLYKEWFVHLRFPGHEHSNFTPPTSNFPKGLPEGWEKKPLGDVAATNAESYKANNLPHEINYIDISSVKQGQIFSKNKMSSSKAPGRARRKGADGDVIWSNVRPNLRAYALILEPEENDVFSTGFTILSPTVIPFSFLYLFVTTDEFVGHLVNHTTGASYPAVRPDDFERANMLVPSRQILGLFHEKTGPIFRLISMLQRENKPLAKARDLLLPRLMNGEVTV